MNDARLTATRPRTRGHSVLPLLLAAAALAGNAAAQDGPTRFGPMDVFALQYAEDPQISPDGSRIVYVRRFADVMTDRGPR